MMLRGLRRYTTGIGDNYFKLFPKSFPNAGFSVDLKKLRKEYRVLQSVNHPDKLKDNGEKSAIINKAYECLSDPLKRSQYLVKTYTGTDLNSENAQNNVDPGIFMKILEFNENIENISTSADFLEIKEEINGIIKGLITELEKLFEVKDFAKATEKTIELKYFYNIRNTLKQWENEHL